MKLVPIKQPVAEWPGEGIEASINQADAVDASCAQLDMFRMVQWLSRYAYLAKDMKKELGGEIVQWVCGASHLTFKTTLYNAASNL